MGYMSDIPRRWSAEFHAGQSLGAYPSQSDWQEAAPLEQFSPIYVGMHV